MLSCEGVLPCQGVCYLAKGCVILRGGVVYCEGVWYFACYTARVSTGIYLRHGTCHTIQL